jgi:hypothetical protein
MGSAKANLIRPATGLFVGAMCIMYPQQIGGFVVEAIALFSDMIVKIISGPLLTKSFGNLIMYKL